MLLALDDIRKRFGRIEALRGLTATVDARLIGLLGPNGAGKSTLLRALLGLTPFTGEARVLGLDPRTESLRLRDRIGYMPEMDSYLPHLNAVELCTYAGELAGLPRTAAMQRAHAALYYANLEDKRYLPVAGYSTGMKQRVKLAQALVHDPELLFLDEPTNGLDPTAREEMLALIADLPRRRGLAVVLSTHLLPDVERLCDHVLVLAKGQLQFSGTVDELRGGGAANQLEVRVKEGDDRLAARLAAAGCLIVPLTTGLRVTLPAGADPDLVLREAIAASVQVRHLAPMKTTLEDAFLQALET